ncbi:MarR family winged helix-turn-helix transcriptional regulator [Marinomonas shanghaiensis]|uniref:MarR family winged helix-turn-helix transcriptional regulator n=1 Tax=Marinomonas shanghaiensis TaxID=2202418 RepID=UPI003A93F317
MKKIIEPQGCTNLKLRQLSRMVTRHYDYHVAECGLKNTQYALLSVVLQLGPIRPSDLAKEMQMDASTLTRNMKPLIAKEWLKMRAGSDARSRLVEITATGKAKRAEGEVLWQKAQRSLNEKFGIERVAVLHDLLDVCIESLDDQ